MSFLRKIGKHIRRRWFRYTVLVLLLCGYGVMKAGEWEAEQLECTLTELPADTLPGCGPLRIAFLADVHNNRLLFNRAIEEIEAAEPDLIIFGGDLVMVDQRFKRTRWVVEGFRRLAKTAPCYAVLGNQDYEKQEQVERVLATAGVTLLRNQAVDWRTPSGATLRIVGLGDALEGDEAPQACMDPAGVEAAPVLLLSHGPDSSALLQDYHWNLMLSGHNHAGQLGNPFTGEYICFRSDMPAGLYDSEGGRRIFVTRGVGSIMGMRFFCRPEVSILDIRGMADENSQ